MDNLSKEQIAQNFIKLYQQLIDELPHLAVHNFNCENSDYSDQLNDSKNAYLCFNGYGIEDCYYTYDSRWNKNCADLTYSNNCELCYDCIDCEQCYNCNFLQDCERCVDCSNCYDCLSCNDCFGCVGLKKKQFCVFNEQYSKSVYEMELEKVKSLKEAEIVEKLEELKLKHPHLAKRIRRSDSCFGNYIFDSKNSNFAFKVHDLEDCVYTYDSKKLKDCVDVDMIHKSQLMYEAVEATDNYNCNFLFWCANCSDCEYVMYCFDCAHCFGCFNLKRKKFHILNQPYSESDYHELVAQIKENLRKEGNYYNFLKL